MAEFHALAAALAAAGRRMDARLWVPGSSGNLSARVDERTIAVTRSGVHKGRLAIGDVIAVDYAGRARDAGAKPSAETLLHCQIYRLFDHAGAVLHGHSVAATVLSIEAGSEIRFAGYELLKAFRGITTHETDAVLPVFDNDQNIERLAAGAQERLRQGAPLGYVIRGHGVYAWGEDVELAFWRLEALEFLLQCELERRRLR